MKRDIEEGREGRKGGRLIGGIRMDAKKSWNDQVANPSSHVRLLPRRRDGRRRIVIHVTLPHAPNNGCMYGLRSELAAAHRVGRFHSNMSLLKCNVVFPNLEPRAREVERFLE